MLVELDVAHGTRDVTQRDELCVFHYCQFRERLSAESHATFIDKLQMLDAAGSDQVLENCTIHIYYTRNYWRYLLVRGRRVHALH